MSVVQARETANASLIRARTSLKRAQDQLAYTRLSADFDGIVTAVYLDAGQVVNSGQKDHDHRPARDPRGRDRRAAQRSPTSSPRARKFDTAVAARPGADRQGRRRARRRSGGRHRDPHAQRLLQPRQSARAVPPRHHGAGDVEPAGFAARRPAGDRAAGEGRQDPGLDRRSRHRGRSHCATSRS